MTNILSHNERRQSIMQALQRDVFEAALEILKRPSDDRTKEEVDILVKASEKFDFFQEMQTKKRFRETHAHWRCCKRLQLESISDGCLVFEAGMLPDKFYIVLRGSVNVLIRKDPERKRKEILEYKRKYESIYLKALDVSELAGTRNQQVLREDSKIDQTKIIKLLSKEINYPEFTGGIEPDDMDKPEKYFEDGVFIYNCVGNIGKGRIFGELGLLMKKPRAATIIVKESAQFGTLSKIDYEEILMKTEVEKMYRKIQLFRTYLPQRIGTDTISKFAYLFQKQKFLLNQAIYQQGDPASYIYFIKSGQILLYKDVVVSRDEEDGDEKKRPASVDNIRLNINDSKKARIARRPIQDLSVGHFFGEHEILNSLKAREFGALSVSAKTRIFVASKAEFMKIVGQTSDIHEFFKDLADLRSWWHDKQEINIVNTAKIAKNSIQNMGQTSLKSHRVSSDSIDRSYNKLTKSFGKKTVPQEPKLSPERQVSQFSPREATQESARVHQRTLSSRGGEYVLPQPKILPAFRKSLPNTITTEKIESVFTTQAAPISPTSSTADSIAMLDKVVKTNSKKVELVLASSKATGYQTLLNLKSKREVLRDKYTISELKYRKWEAQKQDANRHFETAWKDVNIYKNLEHSAQKLVSRKNSARHEVGDSNDISNLRINGLQSSRIDSRAVSRSASRAALRTASSSRPLRGESSGSERIKRIMSASTLSFRREASRPTTAATNLNSMKDLHRDITILANSTNEKGVDSPVEKQLFSSTSRKQQEGLNNIEEELVTQMSARNPSLDHLKIAPLVNAQLTRFIPKLKFRAKICSEDAQVNESDSLRSSIMDMDSINQKIESRRSKQNLLMKPEIFSEHITTSYKPFYATAPAPFINRMVKAKAIIKN